ncbi:MAG: FAD-dependent oxidoreductase [Candidatus Theseobacter exili]|nr:FAD-dependent oxidoreductase [Candidatus Theseobacter exili]
MEKKTDVVIIGGGPAGVVTASTARKYYPDKSITLMKSIEHGCIPCGIPYMFSSLENPDDNKLSTDPLEKKGIDVVVDEAISVLPDTKIVETKNGDTYSYEKLVLAVGSEPIIPPIKGMDKDGVFPIFKDMTYLNEVVEKVKKKKKVLVIGGGFIGVEFADEIATLDGIEVTLVEMLPNLLANSFDKEFSVLAEEKLRNRGVTVIKNARVEELIGNDHVEKARLSNGEVLSVDSVILGIGARPDIALAKDAGLEIGKCNGVLVDEYMRTSTPDIFAVGDCSCKRDFFTRKATSVMLASTATAEARVAGANLYKIKVVRENKGTIAVYSTYINGLVLSSAGLTQQSAEKEGFEIIVGEVEGVDKHPGTLPGASKSKIKLVFSKQSGIILGGQISCGMSCAQLVNLIGVAIQKRMSATELETLQLATHPYLTSSPTQYPVVLAAQDASGKM